MAQNFVACNRDQELLLPPSLCDWLPEGHLAWFVIDAVAQLDLTAFYAAYRIDGHGRPAHDPAMIVALLLYGYAIGERSSRRLERRCVEDVATRVICANQVPDHTTIARFRQRHETALAELFGDVLELCAEAGLLRAGVIAVDGTKVAANAAGEGTRDYAQIAREILEEADAVDAEEDERFGDARGDELPPELATAQGRRGWLREAKRRLDDKRAGEARPIPRDRGERLREAKRRLEEEHHVECRANAAYEAYRARGVDKNGKKFGRPPKPFAPPLTPEGKINLSDLDSRDVKKRAGTRPGWDGGAYAFMRRVLASEPGGALYGKRQTMIEPVFADTKFNRRIDRFLRRGRSAARSEWRLGNAAHNLLKLWRASVTPAAASANGLPSESRHTAQRSPGWMTEPPNSRVRSSAAGRSATVKYGSDAV